MDRYMPMKAGTYTLSSGFGPRWGVMHAGQDFAANDGEPFYACQGGTVLYIGPADGYGQWIVLDHSDADGAGVTEYGHMWDAFATGLKVGDRVEAGQLIGYVGANGQSTGPHLHLSVMPHAYNPAEKIDPMPWLAGALEPGAVAPAAVPAVAPDPAPVAPASGAPFFGIDIASYQAVVDMAQVKAEGFTYVLAKATEGADYVNPAYVAQRDGARAAGLLFGSYHYVTDSDARAQVDNYERTESDRAIPVMLDVEKNSGDVSTLRSVRDEFSSRGYCVNLIYLPNWYWSGDIGSPDLSGLPPLMASSYVDGSGFASELYPGNDDSRWNGYGNNSVAVLQFSDKGEVAGFALDVNAFRGDYEQLATLFNVSVLEAVTMSLSDDELSKRFSSRSIYRDTDAAVDTLAGFVMNIDARAHEDFVERQALRGVPDYVAKVQRVADAGMAGVGDQDSKNRAQAILKQISAVVK